MLTLAVLLAPTATSESKQPDTLAVSVVRIDEAGVVVTWTPAPGALAYLVYRGTDLEDLRQIARTSTPVYTDSAAPNENVWYVIVGEGLGTGHGARGKCLAMRGATGIAVTAAHCVPDRVEDLL